VAKSASRPGPTTSRLKHQSLAAVAGPAVADLNGIIVTELLQRRPARPADHAAESRALLVLGKAIGEAPLTVLQTLVDLALELTGADSAGISVLEDQGDKRVFRWRATAGAFFPFAQGTLPRDFSPCGFVVDHNAPQLMSDPVRFYPYIADIRPHVSEVLLVPFHRDTTPVGTVWVVAHTGAKHFDAEDERVITSLSKFASAAVQVVTNIEALEAAAQSLAAEVG
jgi:GAF domain-containing protein